MGKAFIRDRRVEEILGNISYPSSCESLLKFPRGSLFYNCQLWMQMPITDKNFSHRPDVRGAISKGAVQLLRLFLLVKKPFWSKKSFTALLETGSQVVHSAFAKPCLIKSESWSCVRRALLAIAFQIANQWTRRRAHRHLQLSRLYSLFHSICAALKYVKGLSHSWGRAKFS
jgi:hypothetical protein